MKSTKCQVSHPLKGEGTEQAERKGEPSLGSGSPSITALSPPSRQAFEQQPDETNRAFAAFTAYLDLGSQRSLKAVGLKVGKNTKLMERWSKRNRWVARVAAHGQHMAALTRQAEATVVQEFALVKAQREAAQQESEWQTRCEALTLARETIQRWRGNPEKFGTLEGIARLLELASKLGRLSCGMATDKTQQVVEETRTLSVEFQTAIEKIYGQPVPAQFVDVQDTSPRPSPRSGAGDRLALPEVKP